MSYTALLIPADEELSVERITINNEEDSGLKDLQAAVEGHIEALPVPEAEGLTAYGNEDAKGDGLPKNVRATRLMGPILFAGDCINGNLVICGFDPSTGENLDCPEGFEERLGQTRELRDPDETEINLERRSIEYAWKLYVTEDEMTKRDVEHWVVLSCSHSLAGVNYFSGRSHGSEFTASIHPETRERHDGYTSRGFMVGQGLVLLRREVARYNLKQFEVFGNEALEMLRETYGESHEQVTRQFKMPNGGSL